MCFHFLRDDGGQHLPAEVVERLDHLLRVYRVLLRKGLAKTEKQVEQEERRAAARRCAWRDDTGQLWTCGDRPSDLHAPYMIADEEDNRL